MISAPSSEPEDTEPEDEDFVDTSAMPPTLFVEAWAPTAGDANRAHTLAVPPSLVAEALA